MTLMGGECSMLGEYEKYIQTFSRKSGGEKTTGTKSNKLRLQIHRIP
jgi:hypothetical protein